MIMKMMVKNWMYGSIRRCPTLQLWQWPSWTLDPQARHPLSPRGTSQDAAAAASSVLGSSEPVSILTTDSQGTHLGPAGQSADSPPALTVTALREPEPVDPQLLEHQQVVHRDQEESQQKEPAGLKSLSCTVCQKRFSGADTLRVHEQTHSEENKFICSTCGKCFHRKCTFVCHMRRHSEEKLDGCTRSGTRVNSAVKLSAHATTSTDTLDSTEGSGRTTATSAAESSASPTS
ncbi:hypothetical protein Q5P01_009555 [Channa striata]|uniref:C2H2-type domain-containing protein n=1 Tax=Channa striata TaxID=64152 RepID=A0AA88N0X5_CHASR|nr:hypothetical protein Q5P01_009555 [Channa striata]